MQPGMCCDSSVSLDFDGGLQIGDSVADVKVIRRPGLSASGKKQATGAIARIENALQQAIHPDGPLRPGDYARNVPGGGMFPSVGSNVIPFPVVSPYRPLTKPRSPITGLTAFPKSGYYFNGEPVNDFNAPDEYPDRTFTKDEVPGYESLGFVDPHQSPTGIALPDQETGGAFTGLGGWPTIIGNITSTIPGIISAAKGQPYYDPRQQQTGGPLTYEGPGSAPINTGGAAADIGARAGSAVGGIGDTISDIVTQHPYVVIAAGAALLLLFMKPPSRR